MKKVGLSWGTVEPCLYKKRSTKIVVYVALYVDNNLMIEKFKAIDGTA